MTLNQLRYFVVLAGEKTMTGAARKLFISQPSLSAALTELESELGVSLISRSRKGLSLTEEGIRFLKKARLVVEQADSLLDDYRPDAKRRQTFAVSTLHFSFSVEAFVEMVRENSWEDYELAIRETRTREVISDVASCRSEIGILYLSSFNERHIRRMLENSQLHFSPLCTCQTFAYLHKSHPLASQENVRMSELQAYTCLSFEQGDQSVIYDAEEILADNRYDKIIKANDRATILNLMKGLDGYTLCSGIISENLNGDDFLALPFIDDLTDEKAEMTIGTVTRADLLLSHPGQAYLDTIRKVLNRYTGNTE